MLSKYANNRHLWLYDSFEGMPETTDKDGAEAKKWVGECKASEDDVYTIMKQVGTPDSSYTIKKGYFQDTFKTNLPEKIALLHCDADWYDSVTIVLDTMFEKISTSGFIVLDEYGYWEGCRKAYDNFCKRNNISPRLIRVGSTQAYWEKSKPHSYNSIKKFR